MALAFGNTEITFKKTGTKVTVPNNPKAKLMYYLDCICTTLKLDDSDSGDLRKLRDYDNYYRLTDDETTQLLLLSVMISPDILLNKVIFQNDAMCGDLSNQFYEIGAVRNRMVVSNSIIIGGRQRSVNKIMTFKMAWLRYYYLEPMESLAGELEARQERARQAQRRQNSSDCIIL